MSREQKKSALQKKYHLLRSITNSNSEDKASILKDASKYIKELKQNVERLNQDIGSGCSNQTLDLSSTAKEDDDQRLLPQVNVETHEKGFLINVYLERSCSGLLVTILEAFEDLGLEMRDANISCDNCFQLEALGEENEGVDNLDAQIVRQAVLQAIKNCNGGISGR